eukprot:81790_1
MAFQRNISDGILKKYGDTIAHKFNLYCNSEKISDDELYYDLTQMTYKWSIMEVFLIDVLLLDNHIGKTIYNHMKCLASAQPEPKVRIFEDDYSISHQIGAKGQFAIIYKCYLRKDSLKLLKCVKKK